MVETEIAEHSEMNGKLWTLCIVVPITFQYVLKTLSFQGEWDFYGTLPKDMPFTAHPKFDPQTGEGYAYGVQQGMGLALTIYRMERDGKLKKLYALPQRNYFMIHDMLLAREHLIFVIPPVYFDFMAKHDLRQGKCQRAQIGRMINRPLALFKWAADLFAETLAINLAATAFVVILQFWFSSSVTWRGLLLSLCVSFIFSVCIGNLIGVVISLAGPYFSAMRSPRNMLALISLISAAAALGCVIASSLVIVFGLYPPRSFFAIAGGSLKLSVLIGLIFGLSSFFYEKLKSELEATQSQLGARQLEEERARKLALAAQLSSLESRLRPHLLFNTLNSISALIREDPERAERMVERLSALLRFSLDSSERNTVPLGDEVKIVADYLEIERARFGERLRFTIEIPDCLTQIEVPPFCLQTLVENSVKHAVSIKRAGAELRVKAESGAESVILSVSDDGPGFTAGAIIAGHGLDNLQARLSALYGDRATLDIRHDERLMKVMVTLPL